jgi:hypothetical protein
MVVKYLKSWKNVALVAMTTLAMAIATLASNVAVFAQDASSQGMKPLLVVSLSSYDELVKDVNFLGELAGTPDLQEKFEGILKEVTQGQGLAGLDKTKPLGVIVQTDGVNFQTLAFIPVTDLKKVLDTLSLLQVEAEETGDGVYEIQAATPAGPQSLYVKQSGGWAFVAQTSDALAELPADPTQLLTGLQDDYDIAVRAHVQNIPEFFRQMAVAQIEAGVQQGFAEVGDQQNAGADLQQKLAAAQMKSLKMIIEGTDHVTLGWQIDSGAQTTHLDFSLVAVPGSQLAKQASGLADTKSAFAGFLAPDAAVCLNFSSHSSEEDIQQALSMLQTARKRAVQAIDEEAGLPSDTARDALKSVVNQLMDAVVATVKSGTMDGGMLLELKPAAVTLAAGMHLIDAAKVETALKQVAQLLKDEADIPRIDWGVDQHAGVTFHTATVPIADAEASEIFGATTDVVVGIGAKSLYVGIGKTAIDTLKTAIDQSKTRADTVVSPVTFVLSLGKIMSFAAPLAGNPDVGAVAEALNQTAGTDHINITVKPISDGFTYRIEVEKGVLAALGDVLPGLIGGGADPDGF